MQLEAFLKVIDGILTAEPDSIEQWIQSGFSKVDEVESKDRSKAIFYLNYYAGVRFRSLHNPQLAFKYLHKSSEHINSFEGEDFNRLSCKLFNLLGILDVGFGNIDESLLYFKKSLEFAEKLYDEISVARLLNNIGAIYNEIKDNEVAFQYYTKAAEINLRIGQMENYGKNLCNIGANYNSLKDYKNAASSFIKAIDVHSQIQDFPSLIIDYANLAIAYLDDNCLDNVLPNLEKSMQLIHQLGNKEIEALNYSTYGKYWRRKDDVSKAIHFFKLSISKAIEIENLRWELDSSEELVNVFEEEKKWEQAYTLSKRLFELKEKMRLEEFKEKLKVEEAKQKLEVEEASRIATEKILHRVLPEDIANRIKLGATEIMEEFECGTVLFADISGFTEWSSTLTTSELAFHLNKIFSGFDQLCDELGVEKIKTIGDAYMCVTGLPERCLNHELKMANFALQAMLFFNEYTRNLPIDLRIGIHSGAVVAGVLGKNKYSYDLWGDTVNTASRMESYSEPGKIHVSSSFFQKLNQQFVFESRGSVSIKGKGIMDTYYLIRKL